MARTMPKHVPNGCGSAFGACLGTSAPQMACLGVIEPSLGCPPLPDPPRSWWGRLHRQLLRLHPSTNSSFCVGAPHRYLTYSLNLSIFCTYAPLGTSLHGIHMMSICLLLFGFKRTLGPLTCVHADIQRMLVTWSLASFRLILEQ